MEQTLEFFFSHFNEEMILSSGALALFFIILLLIYWSYNRKKYNNFLHQVPANVLKGYLDSIIQNSQALGSSLSRGGELSTPPTVVPLSGLGGGDSSGVSSDMLNQKNAELASMHGQLSEKQNIIKDLESKIKMMGEGEGGIPHADFDAVKQENAALKVEVEEMKKLLAQKDVDAGGADGASSAELAKVTTERDELKDRLKEYEIIEDDLANLKKLQTENEELKKQLAGGAGAAVAATVAAAPAESPKTDEPVPASEPEPAPELKTASESEKSDAPEGPAVEKGEDPPLEGEEKSAEDLLGEFEKMLG